MSRTLLAAAFLLLFTSGCIATDAKCQGESQLRSLDDSAKTKMKFTNHSKNTKRIYWLNYDGVRVLYAKLAPGRTYRVDTFLTHPWVITRGTGDCHAVYLPNKFPMAISID